MAKKTARKKISDVVTLLDNKDYLRDEWFKKFSLNSVEAMAYYFSFGERAKEPFVGWFKKKFYEQYYKYVHTSAIKLPLFEIERLIDKCENISVGPCPCRLYLDNNEAPMYTCIHFEYFSDTIMDMQNGAEKAMKKKGRKFKPQNRELTNEETLELVRYLNKEHNMIFSLEQCGDAHANNLCCCTWEGHGCIELTTRYDYGFDVCPCGPYIPKFDNEKCVACGKCVEKCPVEALRLVRGEVKWADHMCLGCGNCVNACGADAIKIELQQDRVKEWKEPGPVKLMYIKLLARIMEKCFNNYKKNLPEGVDNNKLFTHANPNEHDIVWPKWYDDGHMPLQDMVKAKKEKAAQAEAIADSLKQDAQAGTEA